MAIFVMTSNRHVIIFSSNALHHYHHHLLEENIYLLHRVGVDPSEDDHSGHDDRGHQVPHDLISDWMHLRILEIYPNRFIIAIGQIVDGPDFG